MKTNSIHKRLIISMFVLTTILGSCLNITITNSNNLIKGFELDPGSGDGGGTNGVTIPYISYPDATDHKIDAEFIIIGMGEDQNGVECIGAWEDAVLWCMWASAFFNHLKKNYKSFQFNIHLLGQKDSVNQESLFDAPESTSFKFDYHKATLQNIYDITAEVVENSDPNDLIFFIYSGHGFEVTQTRHFVTAYDRTDLYDFNLKKLFEKFACADSATTYDSKLFLFMDTCHADEMNEIMSIKASKNVLMFAACESNSTTRPIFFSNMPDENNKHGALTGYFMEEFWDKSSFSWKNFDLALETIFDNIKPYVKSVSTPVLEDGDTSSYFYLQFYDN
ncbi:MAG: caspase family protein [Candidatus Heimdallarchaeum endolithica]|uniref:Caspase family protein n=1 Tax=Candidatus Heimdallarchaeum endolithica TaxID=2876572 RepID=A0A9Y1FM06_9ARCH|nr:MAG: caspase family protein [Candidatus Heimdallarchaeum endolithica]